jgi:hypothetical protein
VINELASVAQDRIGRADASKWASWAYLGRCCAVKGVSDGKRTRNHTYTRILVLMEQVCDFSVRTGSRGKKRRFLHLFTSLVWSSTIAMGGGKWGLFQPYY